MKEFIKIENMVDGTVFEIEGLTEENIQNYLDTYFYDARACLYRENTSEEIKIWHSHFDYQKFCNATLTQGQ